MMKSKKNKKGFTLMEMLIVVAIIVILIAIMIPTFNGQMEKTREAADAANIRAAYAEAMVDYLNNTAEATATCDIQQKEAGWSNTELKTNLVNALGLKDTSVLDALVSGDTVTVTVSDTGEVTLSK